MNTPAKESRPVKCGLSRYHGLYRMYVKGDRVVTESGAVKYGLLRSVCELEYRFVKESRFVNEGRTAC